MAHQRQLMPTAAHGERQDRRAPTMVRRGATGRRHPTQQTQESSHRATSTWTRPALKLQEETNIWASSARSSQPATISCQDCC